MSRPTVTNSRMDFDEFLRIRRRLFAEQLGREPHDLDEAVAFARTNAARGTVSDVLAAAKAEKRTVVVPRAGVAHWKAQRDLMRTLDHAGAGFLPITVDSLTRDLRFSEAAELLAESTEERSRLNGYPIVAHGIDVTRRLIGEFDKPVIVRANAPDLRTAAEVALASGATGFVSGPLYATLEYSKRVSLTESIPMWQYIFRLMGHYTENGVALAEDCVGLAQSGTCSVPSLMHVGVVLEALIMAAQGVKHLMIYSMLQGNIAQDVASCLAVEQLTREYLDRFGFHDVQTYVASSDWNGAFPVGRPEAYGLIATNIIAVAIARPPLNYVKSIDEGRGVPTAESNANSIRISRYLLEILSRQAPALMNEEIEFELQLNLMETRGMVDAILDAGDGDPVVGAIRGLETGLLDVPFSPNIHVAGNVLPIRDAVGAVRFLDHGKLAVPQEALRLERERLARRASNVDELGYEDVIADLGFFEAGWLAPDAER